MLVINPNNIGQNSYMYYIDARIQKGVMITLEIILNFKSLHV